MTMIDVTEYKKVLNQRDDTIIKQADDIAELRSELARSQKTLKGIRWHIVGLDSGALGRSPGGFSYRDEMVNNIGIVLNKTEGKS